MLTHIKEIIQKSEQGGYAVPAFNVFNLETVLAVVEAAVNKQSPIIIQATENSIKYAGFDTLTALMKAVAEDEKNNIPIALHLDHGKSLEVVKACVDAGFSSVHMDGSKLDYDENVAITKQAVDYAHTKGCWTQGELGAILGRKAGDTSQVNQDELEAMMTQPDQAKDFVDKTGIDTLAPSIGAMHGNSPGLEKINHQRLKEIKESVNMPLVLHGGSGVAGEDIKQAIANGINVINIDTEFRQGFTQSMRQTLAEQPDQIDPRKIFTPAMQAVQKVAEQKIELFGSANKA